MGKNPLTRSGSTRILHNGVVKKLRASKRASMWDTIGFTDKARPSASAKGVELVTTNNGLLGLTQKIDNAVINESDQDQFDEGTYDATYNRSYYTHKKTGRTTWTEPNLKKVIDKDVIDESEKDDFDEGTYDATYGRNYYTHKKTGRATWTDPNQKKKAPKNLRPGGASNKAGRGAGGSSKNLGGAGRGNRGSGSGRARNSSKNADALAVTTDKDNQTRL